MDKYLKKLQSYNDENISIEDISDNAVTVIFGKETIRRKQKVSFSVDGKYTIFQSMVMKKKQVKKHGNLDLLQKLWERNNYIDLVGFSINEKGNCIWKIVQLADYLDYE